MQTIELKKNNSIKRIIDNQTKRLKVIDAFFNDGVITTKTETYKPISDEVEQLKEGVNLIDDIRLKVLCQNSVTNSTKRKVIQQLKEMQ